jgi:hypothetical protein
MGDVIGTSGADILTENPSDGVSNNTNNTFYGLEGDDVIIAGPATEQTYLEQVGNPRSPNFVEHSVQDNDTVIGGLGDDTMTGGYGNDHFVFNFLVSATQPQHVDLSAVTHIVVGGIAYDRPAANASITAWNNWNAHMAAYVDSLGGEATTTAFTNTNPSGRNVGTIDLVTGYDIGGGVSIAGEGDDVVTDFTHTGAGSNDELVMNGLSADAAAVNYWGNFLHLQEDISGETITWAGGSISLVGVHGVGLQQMVDDGWIVFG